MDDFAKVGLAVLGGTFTLAIISVLVSRQAQTSQVIGATGSAVSGIVSAAVSPVTGSSSGGGSSFGSAFGGASNALGTLQSISSSLGSFSSLGSLI